jgi:3-deoxy-D-arabino-heptulosonate 7-phosphate (DAHP) synthase class II
VTSVAAPALRYPRADTWQPQSWRQLPAGQQPDWPDERSARDVLRRIRELPGLVSADECTTLLGSLAQVGEGRGFLVQGGDCAETFGSLSSIGLNSRCRLLTSMARTVTERSGRPAVIVGRMAGQYAKPRTAAAEDIATDAGTTATVPSYRGDMVNAAAPDPSGRQPDPSRMLTSYLHAAAALNALRIRPAGEPWIYTSHEALVLGYEEALARFDQRTGEWFSSSAHLLWAGERTRARDGAHVRFLSGLANPVAVKIGPGATPGELLELCDVLNPARRPGRLTLVTRLGAATAATVLPPLIRAVNQVGHPVVWVCDPMHGNTRRTKSGYKTRDVAAVIAEIRDFFAVHRTLGTHPGGIHLELAGEHVTECVGGTASPVAEDQVPHRYQTACDPRLSPAQALECAAVVAAELSH